MEIIPYREEMRPAVIEFFNKAAVHLGWPLFSEGSHPDIFGIRETYQVPGGQFLLAIDDGGQVVGAVGIKPWDAEIAHVWRLYWLPGHRQGLGVLGKRLFKAAQLFAKEHGWKKIQLSSLCNSTTAHRLFELMGCRKTEEPFPGLPYSPVVQRFYFELGL